MLHYLAHKCGVVSFTELHQHYWGDAILDKGVLLLGFCPCFRELLFGSNQKLKMKNTEVRHLWLLQRSFLEMRKLTF